MSDEVSLEGYICPHCMENQGSMTGLQQHFEEVHSQKRSFTTLFKERESSSFMKGIIGKAKEKFTTSSNFSQNKSVNMSMECISDEREPIVNLCTQVQSSNPSGINKYCWEPQEIGSSRCFMSQYKPMRDRYVDQLTVETNQVLIRLGKITSMKTATVSSPSDKKMRKMEMEVVQWQSDRDGKYCAICTKKLLMTSKHHCRLCGLVICNKCSMFLPMPMAMLLEKTNKQCLDEQACRRALRIAKEQANELSVNGKLENALRLCMKCNAIIEKRIHRLKSVHTRPKLSLLYVSICDMMKEVDNLLPMYEGIVSGILEGKVEHTSDEAKRIRFSILQLYESIDAKSKKALALIETSGGTGGAEVEPSARQMKLHKGVRSFAVKYLQERIACLPNVPSDAEIARIRKQREEARRLSKSCKLTEKPIEVNIHPTKPRSQSHLLNTGWIASSRDNTALVDTEEDPYVVQLRLLRGFLSQAEKEGRADEVATLTQEVNMLLTEIGRRDLLSTHT